jgi:hypothetical protein
MNLDPYIESLRQQLGVAAEAGGDDARALAERLVAPLEAAVRLTVQDALAAAAEEITLELAPGSVELRLRGREPQFVVSLPPAERSAEDVVEGEDVAGRGWHAALSEARAAGEGDEAAISRINLRLPDSLKSRVEQAASGEGLSVNAWLVRAAATALERTGARGPERRNLPGAQRYTGWAR